MASSSNITTITKPLYTWNISDGVIKDTVFTFKNTSTDPILATNISLKGKLTLNGFGWVGSPQYIGVFLNYIQTNKICLCLIQVFNVGSIIDVNVNVQIPNVIIPNGLNQISFIPAPMILPGSNASVTFTNIEMNLTTMVAEFARTTEINSTTPIVINNSTIFTNYLKISDLSVSGILYDYNVYYTIGSPTVGLFRADVNFITTDCDLSLTSASSKYHDISWSPSTNITKGSPYANVKVFQSISETLTLQTLKIITTIVTNGTKSIIFPTDSVPNPDNIRNFTINLPNYILPPNANYGEIVNIDDNIKSVFPNLNTDPIVPVLISAKYNYTAGDTLFVSINNKIRPNLVSGVNKISTNLLQSGNTIKFLSGSKSNTTTQTVPINLTFEAYIPNSTLITVIPLNCEVAWSSWSDCDKNCGGGVQTQQGTIITQPLNGGVACPTSLTKSQACNTQSCPHTSPLNCEVAWSSWSDCDKNCGGGTQTQQGTIITQPLNGGEACPTSLTKSQACNTQSCPNDNYLVFFIILVIIILIIAFIIHYMRKKIGNLYSRLF